MKKLRIGIDINEANVKNRVGTGQYTFHLLRYFAKHPEIDFHLYHRDPLQGDLPPETNTLPAGGGWHYHPVKPVRGWLRLGLSFYLATHARHDVWWSPAHYMPTVTHANRSIVTIHDLAYEYFPDLFLPSDLYKLKNWTRSAVSIASKIIAVSNATQHDLTSLYNVPVEKITVIHNGFDSDIFNTDHTDKSLLENWDLKIGNYILFLGTIQPRKNAIKLVQAFHLLKEQGYKGKLVIAGNIGWLADETLSVIKNSPDAKNIVLTGYVSDEARKALYSYCDVYVLPSLYEGFGVPAIEAMATGAPVAVANNSSLPEVLGSAGTLFNATDPADIARAIQELKSDREYWIKKSLTRAKAFSWEKCAEETLKVLLK